MMEKLLAAATLLSKGGNIPSRPLRVALGKRFIEMHEELSHPESFYHTIIESPQWKEWEKEQNRRMIQGEDGCFDYNESVELGLLSQNHFSAFCEWLSKRKHD